MHHLRKWLDSNDIRLHPNLDIIVDDHGSVHVIAIDDIPEPNTTIARIPKSVVLSRRNSATSIDLLQELPESTPPTIQLAVCVAYEIRLGQTSRWHDYLLSLPQITVPVAVLWSKQSEARAWASGTELGRMLDDAEVDQEMLISFFDKCLSPRLAALPSPPSKHDFLRAYSLVSSRAFQVDVWHGLALVPLADAFDHSDAHDVHFASETWVCPECGAFDLCEHDEDDDLEHRKGSRLGPERSQDDTCELVSVRPIAAKQEVFNTYGGSNMTNARLLAFYGFILPANKHDTVSFTFDELVFGFDTKAPGSLRESWIRTSDRYNQLAVHTSDSLLCISDELKCDADSCLSSSAWILLALQSDSAPTEEDVYTTWLLSLCEYQQKLHNQSESEQEDSDEHPFHAVLRDIAGGVDRLVLRRLSTQRAPDLSPAELFELAEAAAATETRLSLEYLAGERILLHTLRSNWAYLMDV